MADARIMVLAAAALVVAGTGVWLTAAGRPFGVVLQTVHKLTAVAAVVCLAVIAWRAFGAGAAPAGALALCVAAAILALAAIASGGMVSAMADAPAWVVWGHRTVSWVSIAVAVWAAWVVLPF